MKVDWLVVGAGFTGCTIAERIATQLDQKVLIVEQRDHIGGNAHDRYDEHGVLVHAYGPHIFHTNSKKVWSYLSQFTEWRPYFHQVRAMVDGKQVPVPFNLNSLYALFAPNHAEMIEKKLLDRYGMGVKVPILKLLECEDSDLQVLARYVYDKVFHGYTVKQWELKPEELSPSVTGRVPFYVSRDDRYFQDSYQAMPKHGYTKLFDRMIDHQNIRVLLRSSYEDMIDDITATRLVFTGPIDSYFGYEFGELSYRSLRFEYEHHHDTEAVQEVAQINYPNEYDFTRKTEFKHLTGQRSYGSTVAVEYPQAHVRGETEPYYPIPRDEFRQQHSRYVKAAAGLGDTIFAGRLADYRYYNMDQAVARALSVFENEIVVKRPSAVGPPKRHVQGISYRIPEDTPVTLGRP